MVVSIYDQLSTSASHFRPQSDFTDPFSRESPIGSKLSRCRRGLMFTPRIFHGESIYLDLRTANGSRQRTNLETDLVAFGGQVEAFLSKEVTHVITDRNDIGGSTASSSPIVSKGGRDGLSRTPKALPAALSRAQALLQRSVSKQQQHQRTAAAATDPVSLAKQWGIRVTPLNKVLHIIEREKAKCDPNIKLSNSKQSGQTTVRIRRLEGAFLKVEDTMGKYRPFFKNFSSFPVVDLMDPAISHNQSPFHPRRKAAAAVKRPDVGSNKDMFEKMGNNLSVVSKGQHVNKDTPIPKVTIKKPPKSGFCEICDAHYTNLIEHTQSDSHQMFASGSENFRSLDEIISNLPSLDQLQTGFFSMTLSDTVPSGEISSSLQDADDVKDILPEGIPNVNNISLTEPQKGQKTPEQEALQLKLQQANTGAMGDDTMSHTDVAIQSLPRPIQSILQGTESEVKSAKDSSHHGIDNYSSQEHSSHPPTCMKGSEHICSREDSNQTIIGNQSSPKQSNILLSGQKEEDNVICEPINGTLPDAVFKSSQRQSDHLISAAANSKPCEEITQVSSQKESNIPQDSNLHCSVSNNAQPDIVSETSQKESNISSSSPQKMSQAPLCSTAHIQNDIMQHSSKSPSCVQLGSDVKTIPTMVSSYALKILNSSVEDARELPDIVVENKTEEIGVLSAKPDICQSEDIADNANIIEQSDIPKPSDLGGNGKCDIEAVEENLCQTPDEHLVINSGSPIRNDEAPDTQNSEILPQAPSEGINESIEEPDSEATIIGSVSECDENRLVKNVTSQISPTLVAELQNTQHVPTLQKTPLKDFTAPVKAISDNVRILSESSVQAVLKELNFLNTNFITSNHVDNTVPEDGQKDASQDVAMECEFSNGECEDVAPTLECQLNNTDPSRDLESGSYPSMPELEAEVGFILPEMQFLDAHSNDASMPEPMSSRGSFFDVSPVKLISQFPFSCFDDPEATNAYSAGEANTTAVSSKVFTDNQNTSSYQFNSRLSVAIPDDKHVPTSFSSILSTLNTENSGVVNAEQQVVDYGNMESIISRIAVQPAPEDLDTTFTDTPRVCSATQSTLEDMPSDALGSHFENTNQQIAGTELNLSQDINMEFSDITSSDPMENAIAQNLLARLQNGSSDSESGSECDSALDLPLHAEIGVHKQLTCSEAIAEVPNGLVNVEQVLCDALDTCDSSNATTVNGLQDKVSNSFDMSCFVNPSISIAGNNCTTAHATQEMVLNSSDGSCPESHTIIPPNKTLNAQERVLISSDSSWFVNPPNTNISRQSTTLVVPPENVSNRSGISFCVNPSQNAASNITILTPQERVLITSDSSSSVQSHVNVASYSTAVHAPQEGVSNIPDTFCSVNLSTNAASVFEYCHREQRIMGTVPGTNVSQELTKNTPVSCHAATKLLVQMQPHVTKQQCSAPVPVLGRSKCFQTIGLSAPTGRFHENLGNFSTLSTSSEDVSEVDSNPEPAGEDEEPEVEDAGRWSPSMILNPVSLWWKTDSVSVSKDVVSSEVVEKTAVIQESLTKVPTATKVVETKVPTKYKKVNHAKERNSTSRYSTSNLATDYCDVALDNAVSPSAERSLKDKVKVSKSHKHNKAKPLFPDSQVDDSNHIDKSKYKSKVLKSHRRNKSKPLFTDCDASIGNVDTHLEEVNKSHRSKSHRERKSKSSREAEFDVDVESFTRETEERKHQRKSSKSHKHKRSKPEIRNGDFSPLQPHETSMSQRNVKACTSDKISKARSKHSKEDAKTPRAKQQLPQTATPQRVASLMRHHDDAMPAHSWTVSPSHGLKLKICKVVTPVRDSDIVKSHPTVHRHSELSELEAREHTSEKHRRKDRKLEKGARRRKLAL